MTAVNLRRIDPARNMSRFYRLDIEPDVFGGVLLVKEWGRIGAHGCRALRHGSRCRRRVATTGRAQKAAGIHDIRGLPMVWQLRQTWRVGLMFCRVQF
jgi:predicted DNA-binding WGR domain protein